MEVLKISEARADLSEVIGRARYANEPTMLTDRGKPAAVIVSPRMYAEYRELREAEMRRIVAGRLAEDDANGRRGGRVFTSAEEMGAVSDAERAASDRTAREIA
jgi:prevent-host-death family protein